MKVIYLSAVTMQGISKKNGSNYHFGTLRYAIPVKPVNQESFKLQGFGYEVQELSMETAALESFRDVKPFTVVDIRLEPNPDNPNRNMVTGWNKPA